MGVILRDSHASSHFILLTKDLRGRYSQSTNPYWHLLCKTLGLDQIIRLSLSHPLNAAVLTIGCHHPTNRMHGLWKSLELECCICDFFHKTKGGQLSLLRKSSFFFFFSFCHEAQLGSMHWNNQLAW